MTNVSPTPNLALHAAREQQRNAKLNQASQQFESMLLRRVLSALEKSARVSGTGSGPAGATAYGSMVVEALSDAIAQAGGLGLARDMVTQLAPASGKLVNTSNDLGTGPRIPLKASDAVPITHVRATPSESTPVNRRTE